MRMGGRRQALSALLPGNKPGTPILQEVGARSPRLLWVGAENLAPTGIHARTFQTTASCYTA